MKLNLKLTIFHYLIIHFKKFLKWKWFSEDVTYLQTAVTLSNLSNLFLIVSLAITINHVSVETKHILEVLEIEPILSNMKPTKL